MPFGVHPICKKCFTEETNMWRKTDNGEIQCNECATNGIKSNKEFEKDKNPSETVNGQTSEPKITAVPKPMIALRKSARCKAKMRTAVQNKPNTVKGKGRRNILKRNVNRAPLSFSTPVTSHSIFFKGHYYQIGDIVSMIDIDGGIYYAQITGFLCDQFCEKSATVTWLLPSEQSPNDRFDPSTYFLGPEEEIPRKLSCMQFVCHAPSDYYKDRSSPYPTLSERNDRGFIWTRMGDPMIVNNPFKDDVFGNIDIN